MSLRQRKVWRVIAPIGTSKFHVVEEWQIGPRDLVASGPLAYADAVTTSGELNERLADNRLEIIPV